MLKHTKFVADSDLIKEWDWEENNKLNLNPHLLTIASQKKAHWICKEGHKWVTTINHRGIGGTKCPYCSNRKVLAGFNDFESQFPGLMKEWDWKENNKIKILPNKIFWGSAKKIHWCCSNGHKWITSIRHRTLRGTNCPYCSNKKILPGYNDLKSQRPDLMKEWDYGKNTLNPETVSVFSPKMAYWICSHGHKYEKPIYDRAKGKGCPICVRSKSTSFPEQCFYYYIKKVYPDTINKYKDIFNNAMEIDIYIPSIKTGVEYDGRFWHNKDSLNKEEKKYSICQINGIKLYRIKEGEFPRSDKTADRIYVIPKKCDNKTLNSHIYKFMEELTCFSGGAPKIDVDKDRNKILEYMTIKYEDSLENLLPNIAKEWHPTKNGKLTPDLFAPNSTEKVWWKCPKCGNEWYGSIVNRSNGHGCNICATEKRKLTKKETLLSTRRILDNKICLLDWDYDVNEHGPEYYTNGSGEIVNWKCHICGFKWKTAIYNRTRDYKNGCPLCSGKTIVSGINDLFTLLPDLMKEWAWEKNKDVDPKKIGIGSHLYAYWKCKKCGYIWKAKIYNRVHGRGCPCCANRVIVRGINDLETTNPKLAKEWHPTLNGSLTPNQVTKGQNIKIWWKCSKCGNEWQDTLNHRSSSKRACPKCKGLDQT